VLERLPGLRAHGRARLRLRLSGSDRCDPDAAARRRRARIEAPLRLDAMRRLLRRLPGQDRHPHDPRQAPSRRGASGAQALADRCPVRRGRRRDERTPPLDAGPQARSAHALRPPWRPAASIALDANARVARATIRVVSRLVDEGA
jgi:hypothetical protein